MENCIQCMGTGVYLPIGRDGYTCGFCLGSGKVPVNTQWLQSPAYRPQVVALNDWSVWFGYLIAGSFMLAVVGIVILLCNALQQTQIN